MADGAPGYIKLPLGSREEISVHQDLRARIEQPLQQEAAARLII